MRRVLAILLVFGFGSGCAHDHRQLTNKQVAIGVVVVVGAAALLYLAIAQCHKGASYCDNSPNP
jgi:hypothetical protein